MLPLIPLPTTPAADAAAISAALPAEMDRVGVDPPKKQCKQDESWGNFLVGCAGCCDGQGGGCDGCACG